MDWNKKQIFLCKSFGKKGISECCQVGAVAEHLTPNMESRSLKNNLFYRVVYSEGKSCVKPQRD